ncbi:MAG: hypothetical protein EB127_23270 [Alphaproteobacteria bacterium]|nr:hypothetical protein [Alphaproteobacteria bacterium]
MIFNIAQMSYNFKKSATMIKNIFYPDQTSQSLQNNLEFQKSTTLAPIAAAGAVAAFVAGKAAADANNQVGAGAAVGVGAAVVAGSAALSDQVAKYYDGKINKIQKFASKNDLQNQYLAQAYVPGPNLPEEVKVENWMNIDINDDSIVEAYPVDDVVKAYNVEPLEDWVNIAIVDDHGRERNDKLIEGASPELISNPFTAYALVDTIKDAKGVSQYVPSGKCKILEKEELLFREKQDGVYTNKIVENKPIVSSWICDSLKEGESPIIVESLNLAQSGKSKEDYVQEQMAHENEKISPVYKFCAKQYDWVKSCFWSGTISREQSTKAEFGQKFDTFITIAEAVKEQMKFEGLVDQYKDRDLSDIIKEGKFSPLYECTATSLSDLGDKTHDEDAGFFDCKDDNPALVGDLAHHTTEGQ